MSETRPIAQREHCGDQRFVMWIPLSWARAYLALGAIEARIAAAREFCRRAAAMRSPYALRYVEAFARDLEAAVDAPNAPLARAKGNGGARDQGCGKGCGRRMNPACSK